MKSPASNRPTAGLTLLEVIVVIALLTLLAGLLLPALSKAKSVRHIPCLSNLKQIGLGLRMWSGDHHDKFPWNVSTNEGGTMEFANSTNVFLHFRAASNELNSPKVLVCASDSARSKTNDFDYFRNANLSYFAGLDADEAKPEGILSGDRNISTKRALISGLLALASNSPVRLAPGLHTNYANIGLSDGSAQQVSETQWTGQLNRSDVFPVRLVIP